MGGVPSGGSTWKNVLIGIFTTVAAYAIVHFLGLGKSKKKEEPTRFEATQRALQSVIQYEDIAQKIIVNTACMGNSEKDQTKLLEEFDQAKQNLLNIKNEKDVDNRVYSIVDNRATVMEKLKKSTEKYFTVVNPLVINGVYKSPADSLIGVAAQKTYLSEITEITNDSRTFLSEIKTALKKDYDFKLEYNSPDKAVALENLVGVWKINHQLIWQVNNDKSFTLQSNQERSAGVFSIKDSILTLNFNDGDVANLKVGRLIGNFMMFTNLQDSSYNEACRQ